MAPSSSSLSPHSILAAAGAYGLFSYMGMLAGTPRYSPPMQETKPRACSQLPHPSKRPPPEQQQGQVRPPLLRMEGAAAAAQCTLAASPLSHSGAKMRRAMYRE